MPLPVSRLLGAGATAVEVTALERDYSTVTAIEQSTLDQIIEGVATSDITAMLNVWRGGCPFWGLPRIGQSFAMLTGDPADDAFALGRGTGAPVSAGSGVLYPDGTTTATVAARPGVFYDIRDYGAKVDGVTLADAAMTNGSAVLTSASAGFTSADVGKRVVVNNAKGAGVHLYTTISAYTNATTVTLASGATATITNAVFSYGTDDLAAWTAAIAAAPAGSTILCPGRSAIFGTITPTKAVKFAGTGVFPVYGPFGTTVGGGGASVIPKNAPYLRGSVVTQMKASADAFAQATITGEAVNFDDIGIYFAGMFKTTGHGINFTTPALTGGHGFEQGLNGFVWRNVQVYGHDGTHRAVYLLNAELGTVTHICSYGGGGYKLDQNNDLNPYGNCVFIHPYHCGVDGALNGFDFTTTYGQILNLIQMTRPQAISASAYAGTTFAAWGSLSWTGLNADTSGASQIVLVAPDWENTNVRYGSNTYTLGQFEFASTVQWSGGTSLPDTLPFGSTWNGSRRINRDGSVSLDGVEVAGSLHHLLFDHVSGADWAISTDGNARMSIPGALRATGLAVSSVAGAALGTSPPPLLVKGSEFAGRALFGSGTSPAAGAIGTFTFGRTQAAAPAIVLTALNAATQALGLYVSAITTTTFTVSAANAPSASQSVSTYAFSYMTVDSGGAPPVPVVYDNFDKADSSSSIGAPAIGPSPVANLGTWGISGNTAYLAAGGVAANTVTWDSGLADCTISVKMAAWANQAGPSWRNDGTSMFYVNGQVVWKKSGGSFTNLGVILAPAFTTNSTVQVVLLGSSIKIYVDGILAWSGTDTMNQAVTKHGLMADNTTARFDNFQITP